MPHFHVLDSISSLPDPHDPETASSICADWLESLSNSSSATHDIAQELNSDATGRALLNSIFGNSPYLSTVALRDPAFLCELVNDGPRETAARILSGLADKRKARVNNDALARELRIAKQRMAVTVALADITGLWQLDDITRYLSETASAALSLAAAQSLRDAAAQGAFDLGDPSDPESGSGFIVLGMGKLGAFELNYSSDIDLIVLYDEAKVTTSAPDKLQNRFIRVTRNLVRLMDERTANGYVFRTDLRLRPDPAATPLAMSVAGAETYYESLGQNWERAAMIKARPVAGDFEAGEAFLKFLTPFVWRKNLDFAAIQDIQSIKRQINAHKGGHDIRAAGHNIKLGQGGIREIEFFAQTQQLIWGGREPALRTPSTLQALQALTDFGQCDQRTADELTESYVFLRRVEHRLQMINDEQTQTLPEAPEDFARLSTFLGYGSADSFSKELVFHLHRTQDHYSQLFADAPGLAAEGKGNLVFTGADLDPDTQKTLTGLGFKNPGLADTTVRSWHHGRYRAMRSTRAREILTELMPRLLTAVGNTPDPDAALIRFDEFLGGLPAGVQLFSMIQANPQLLDLLAEIIGTAPRLARHLSGRPSALDSVLTPDFFDPLPNFDALKVELTRQLERAEYTEDILDQTRRWAHDRRFQVGVQRLQGLISPKDASASLSDIADTTLHCLYGPIEAEFADAHGRIPGSAIAILALGKLGSREMTASSDLDLVFIYKLDDEVAGSDGDKPLAPTQYFARLSQRLINALTAPTSEGGLYEVDMRLRPSGNSGPIATTAEAFRKYQMDSAWTWEHMALTRARVVTSTSDDLKAKIDGTIRDVLTRHRDPAEVLRDVASMRTRLQREKPAACFWALKMTRGGIVDIEFIAQFLALAHAAENPDILTPSTAGQLANQAAAGILGATHADALGKSLVLWQGLQGLLSLTVEENITPERVEEFSGALKSRLAAAGGAETFDELETKAHDIASDVFRIFQEIIETPAAKLPPPDNASDDDAPLPPLIS